MSSKDSARWSRVLLKVSGEAFAGNNGYGIDGEIVTQIAKEIVDVRDAFDVDLAVVVGGGNIWRGMSGAGAGMDRAQADYMGMLATSINALALSKSSLFVPTAAPTNNFLFLTFLTSDDCFCIFKFRCITPIPPS